MNKADRLLYQENTAGGNLVVLFVLINMAYAIMNLRHMPVMYDIGIFVMYTILVSLVGFLASTKMRIYSKSWGYAGIVIALIQFVRIPRIPDVYESGRTTTMIIMLVASAVCMIAGSIITIQKANQKNEYEASLKG